jgi:hypothetical protein
LAAVTAAEVTAAVAGAPIVSASAAPPGPKAEVKATVSMTGRGLLITAWPTSLTAFPTLETPELTAFPTELIPLDIALTIPPILHLHQSSH